MLRWVRRAVVWCGRGTAPPHPPAWTKAELCRAVGKHEKHWATHQAINRLIERGDLYANGKLWSPADRLFEAEEAERDPVEYVEEAPATAGADSPG